MRFFILNAPEIKCCMTMLKYDITQGLSIKFMAATGLLALWFPFPVFFHQTVIFYIYTVLMIAWFHALLCWGFLSDLCSLDTVSGFTACVLTVSPSWWDVVVWPSLWPKAFPRSLTAVNTQKGLSSWCISLLQLCQGHVLISPRNILLWLLQ